MKTVRPFSLIYQGMISQIRRIQFRGGTWPRQVTIAASK